MISLSNKSTKDVDNSCINLKKLYRKFVMTIDI